MASEDEAPTCGKGLSATSWLPSKLSELSAALADVLAHHMTALDISQENGKREYSVYESLVNGYREVAARLGATATEMTGYHDLPMADHDMSVMTSPKSLEVFENFVQKKQELREMLRKTIEEDEKMLAQMRGSI